MKPSSVGILHAILCIYASLKYASNLLLEKETQKGVYGAYITLNAPTFRKLIESSDAIVDKTLLIAYILAKHDDKIISINLPRGWGKTINLNMISAFVEKQVNAEGIEIPLYDTWIHKFFVKGELYDKDGKYIKFKKPPLISNFKNITETYLGQFPVIRLDLSINFASLDYAGFVNAFRTSIQRSFNQHLYLTTRLKTIIDDPYMQSIKRQSANQTLSQFIKFADGTQQNRSELLNSIVFLSRTLKRQFNKLVFIFIDEYTLPITNMYLCDNFDETEEQKVVDFYFDFMRLTLQKNKYLYRCLLTGIFAIKEDIFVDVTSYSVMDNTTMQYYGFNKTDLQEFFVTFKIPETKREEAEKWYKGYTIVDKKSFCFDKTYIEKIRKDPNLGLDLTGLLLYNPYSVVNFLNVFNIRNYWLDSEKFTMFHRSFEYIEMRLTFETLAFSNRAMVKYKDLTYTLQDMFTWRKVMNFDASWNITSSMDSILAVFVSAGYLTMGEEGRQSVRIPNPEIFSMVLNELEMYYCTTLRYDMHVVPHLINNTAYTLIRFIEDDENVTLTNLIHDFTSIFEEFDQFKYDRKLDASENEELMKGKQTAIHGIAFMTALCARIMFEFDIFPEISGRKENFIFFKTIYGAVFEIASNYRLTDDIIEFTEKNDTQFFQVYKNIKRAKIIRVLVNDTGGVDIYVKKFK